ncbi:hypothetical protein K469DRAFT_659904 [Zopfia rhizophila CBS 207.26]|uniref:NAD(P)-binding domain-containing protein n=1 Tax=Zopfia rhizophila CBS 207.26 TaxID=1314779 RepID=A0A6A6EEE0_9PEZI|nr:hypothetical protein K469DRAFT_659904 [Zopfia rhizophila CBS 207.26]
MKVIVTGVTGFIGGEVMNQCILDSSITQIFTLSRNPLPERLASNPKVTSIIHKDFSKYPESLLEKLEGAEACLWMIGVAQPKGDPRPVDIGYTQSASEAFNWYLQPRIPGEGKFRFVHTSGILSEKDQDKSLWFNVAGRRSRGASETEILNFAQKHEKTYRGYVVRPGKVLAKGSWIAGPWMAVTKAWCIPVDWLALAMIDVVKSGGERSRIFENGELIERGKGIVNERRGSTRES